MSWVALSCGKPIMKSAWAADGGGRTYDIFGDTPLLDYATSHGCILVCMYPHAVGFADVLRKAIQEDGKKPWQHSVVKVVFRLTNAAERVEDENCGPFL